MWENVGYIPTSPSDYDYKDNIHYGTYIEVEAYYVSENDEQVTNGKILYRYMLGQNDSCNYNAFRNHHYKLTLGFRGYANQPDWHIVYEEPEQVMYIDPTYYISYGYNHRAEFPVRIRGDVEEFDIEIVENNWAPYDPTSPDSVPAATINPPDGAENVERIFRWNRDVYKGEKTLNTPNGDPYYYRLQTPYKRKLEGGKVVATSYADELDLGAPEQVTPIWAGFLALQVPDGNIPTALLPDAKYASDYEQLKDDYYKNNQNWRTYGKECFNFPDWTENGGTSSTNYVAKGTNNETRIVKAADGSITIHVPMWTRPKSMLGISGFTGNNPYETFRRKAMVRLQVKYKDGSTIIRYMPVMQVRRIVNPKGLWRNWNNNNSFDVKLVHRTSPSEGNFSTFASEGAWRAYVKTGNKDFITLSGGVTHDETGAIVGATETPVEFKVNFTGMGDKDKSLCAIVEVEYHGFTCNHSIYVRQGYNEPLQVVEDGAQWSSFSLFSVTDKVPFATGYKKNEYYNAELTKHPLTLGTLFKRGNYNGILIENNQTAGLGALQYPGETTMFKRSSGRDSVWCKINGLAYGNSYAGSGLLPDGSIYRTFEWARFKVTVNGEERKYKLPSYENFRNLLTCDFGVGVLYTDGCTTTGMTMNEAYGFEDVYNDGKDDNPDDDQEKAQTRGSRGVLVVNTENAHQIFFPIGGRGMGRRTIVGFSSDSYDKFGELRYSAVENVLSQYFNVRGGVSPNQFRPIPYNMPEVEGAIYWLDKYEGDYGAWDMNYFDLNFNAYDWGVSRSFDAKTGAGYYNYSGDALPIKLIVDDSATTP